MRHTATMPANTNDAVLITVFLFILFHSVSADQAHNHIKCFRYKFSGVDLVVILQVIPFSFTRIENTYSAGP